MRGLQCLAVVDPGLVWLVWPFASPTVSQVVWIVLGISVLGAPGCMQQHDIPPAPDLSLIRATAI